MKISPGAVSCVIISAPGVRGGSSRSDWVTSENLFQKRKRMRNEDPIK